MKALTESCLSEKIIEIDNPKLFIWKDIFNKILEQVKNQYVIKVNLVKTTKAKLYFHVVCLDDFKGFIENPFYPSPEIRDKPQFNKSVCCLIIPTGIGAKYGGYAGDANVIAKLFAKSSDLLITNPNVVNGAVLSDVPENMMYVEGFLLDQFMLGRLDLHVNNNNKIGVIFDKGVTDERLDYELNCLNSLRVFYGCNIFGWTQTGEPLKVIPALNEYGFSSGTIEGLECLIEKALKLKQSGATAIAVCCVVPDLDLNKNYINGLGIDPIGGIESIISHSVSASTGLVSAHAPVLEPFESPDYKNINPVSGSEYIAKSFLPSVISGLRFAPLIVGAASCEPGGVKGNHPSSHLSPLTSNLINKIIVPYNAFGSAGVFFQNECFQNVTLIKENKTCLQVNPEDVNLNFKIIDSYLDIIDDKVVKSSELDLRVLQRPVDKIPKL